MGTPLAERLGASEQAPSILLIYINFNWRISIPWRNVPNIFCEIHGEIVGEIFDTDLILAPCRLEGCVSKESDKRANFVRLAEGRTQLALDAIRKIGNLSNSRAYEYTDADVKLIIKALRDATADIERKFNSSTGETFNKFRLKG